MIIKKDFLICEVRGLFVLAVLDNQVVCQRTDQLCNFTSKGTRAKRILQERQKSSLFSINVIYHHV
jgi:hypothetical protein